MEYSSDVYFIYHPDDEDFMKYFAKKLTSDNVSVWNGKTSNGEGLIDSKVVITIMSTELTHDNRCEDEVSLAYISDTPIFPVSRQSFVELEANLSFSMKLILAKLNWMFFETDNQKVANYPTLLNSIKSALALVAEQVGETELQDQEAEEEEEPKSWKARDDPDMKIRQGVDFWEEKFGSETEVPWSVFRAKFLEEYRAQLLERFTEEKIQWLTNLLYGDILLLRKVVSRHTYSTFCGQIKPGKEPDPDRFYNRLIDYAKGNIAMRGVFNMDSTVRLDAIQRLGKFKTQSVIAALLDLSADQDANVRAVSAIALGKTGIKSRRVSQRMIKLLSDEDRLVREAACISLGRMKIETAVPQIVQVWRKDVISHVRAAAEVALGLIDSDRAKQSIQVTKVLRSELNELTAK